MTSNPPLLNRPFLQLLNIYQHLISPFVNRNQPTCIYKIPCSQFTRHQLETKPLPKALYYSAKRILSCNPANAKRLQSQHSTNP